MKKNIAIFASGSGSNAENIIEKLSEKFNFPLIISNKIDAFVHQRAKKLGIKSIFLPKEEISDGEKMLDFLKSQNIHYIILAGYLLKIPQTMVENFPQKIINIHPALLPKFGGKGMYGDHVHKAVKAAGERESGITIHFVNENYDEGDIIFQAKCEIAENDTPEDIAAKVHQLEYEHLPRVIETVVRSER